MYNVSWPIYHGFQLRFSTNIMFLDVIHHSVLATNHRHKLLDLFCVFLQSVAYYGRLIANDMEGTGYGLPEDMPNISAFE
jgi:hypothetical protein